MTTMHMVTQSIAVNLFIIQSDTQAITTMQTLKTITWKTGIIIVTTESTYSENFNWGWIVDNSGVISTLAGSTVFIYIHKGNKTHALEIYNHVYSDFYTYDGQNFMPPNWEEGFREWITHGTR